MTSHLNQVVLFYFILFVVVVVVQLYEVCIRWM